MNINIHIHSALSKIVLPGALDSFTAEPSAFQVGAANAHDKPGRAARFVTIADEQIVIDHQTGLMWPALESADSYDFEDAEEYARQLRLGGFADWTIPTIEQRLSIVDYSRRQPALFAPLQSGKNDWEWTRSGRSGSEDDAGLPRYLWQVYANSGSVGYGSRGDRAFVRPCRAVAARAGQ